MNFLYLFREATRIDLRSGFSANWEIIGSKHFLLFIIIQKANTFGSDTALSHKLM